MKRNLSLVLALIMAAALVLGGCSSTGSGGGSRGSRGGTPDPPTEPGEGVVLHTN